MIYLIRHTKPKIQSGICYGQSDLDVSESFDKELIKISSKLSLDTSFHCISSPLQRCSKLGKALAKKVVIKLDDNLKELDFGDWELQAWSKLPENTVKFWSEDFVKNRPPNGESFQDLSNRVLQFWNRLDHLNTNYLITAHDGVLRVILSHLLETPLKKAFTLKINYGEVIKIDFFDKENCRIEFVQ